MKVLFWMIVLTTFAWGATETGVEGNVVSSTNWTDPTNTKADDAADAAYDNTTQDWLQLDTFAFGDVEGTIDSIRATLNADGVGGGGSPRAMEAQLVVDGSAAGDVVGFDITNAEGDVHVTGTTNPTWNCGVTVTTIAQTNFGIQIRDGNTSAALQLIDLITIHVFYTPAGGGSTRRRHLILKSQAFFGSPLSELISCVTSFGH